MQTYIQELQYLCTQHNEVDCSQYQCKWLVTVMNSAKIEGSIHLLSGRSMYIPIHFEQYRMIFHSK